MTRLRPRWLAAVAALGAVGVAIAAWQTGAGLQRASAIGTIPSGRCGPVSTAGSTNTAGGGGLVIGQDLSELTKDSERVVVGSVKSYQTCVDHDAGGVSTAVTIDVGRDLKSTAGAPSEVTVVVPGGQFGQLVLRVGTSAEFTAGEQVVAFMRPGDDGRLRLTGEFQGKFTVEQGGVAGAGVDLSTFEEKVTQAVAGTLPPNEDPLGSTAGYGEAAFATSGVAWFPADIPVPYFVNADEGLPAQLSAANVQTAWSNAFSTWENDPGSDISFSSQGSTTRDSGADECGPAFPDGNNDLTWGIAMGHDPSVLAITFTCAAILSGTDQLIDADIEFDADAGHFLNKWRTDGTGSCNSGIVDLESVALHETGHFIGLSHPSSNSCGANGGCPVMNASYQGVKHSLCQDDMDGVASLYPAAVTPTPTVGGAPTNTPTAVPPTNTPTAVPPTNTPTNTNTPAPPASTFTPTNTFTSTNTPTDTFTPTNTRTPTNTPDASATQEPATDTPTSTDTPAPADTATPTPTPGAPTETPAETPTGAPGATDTPTFTPTLVDTPTETPTPTSAATPTRTPTHASPPASTTGDVNCDGHMNSLDALAVLQYSAALLHSLSCPDDADVSHNGHIDALDAALILQFDAGLIHSL